MFFRKKNSKPASVCHDLILVIEDNEDVMHLLEHVLGRAGYCLKFARDGDAALEAIDKTAAPSLVLLDLMIPIHSGLELLRHMRSKPGWRETPVIILSGRHDEDDLRRARELGVDDYLLKPFEPRTLLARVQTLLSAQPT